MVSVNCNRFRYEQKGQIITRLQPYSLLLDVMKQHERITWWNQPLNKPYWHTLTYGISPNWPSQLTSCTPTAIGQRPIIVIAYESLYAWKIGVFLLRVWEPFLVLPKFLRIVKLNSKCQANVLTMSWFTFLFVYWYGYQISNTLSIFYIGLHGKQQQLVLLQRFQIQCARKMEPIIIRNKWQRYKSIVLPWIQCFEHSLNAIHMISQLYWWSFEDILISPTTTFLLWF